MVRGLGRWEVVGGDPGFVAVLDPVLVLVNFDRVHHPVLVLTDVGRIGRHGDDHPDDEQDVEHHAGDIEPDERTSGHQPDTGDDANAHHDADDEATRSADDDDHHHDDAPNRRRWLLEPGTSGESGEEEIAPEPVDLGLPSCA
jgi:hypothetical protein